MSFLQAKSARKLEEKQRQALISLLADDDSKVYRTVRETLLSYGPGCSEWMREHTLSNDPVLRRRATEIVQHFARQDADTQFLAFCLNQGEDFDLESGVLLLSRTQYPLINSEGYSAIMDDFAGDLRERLDLNGPADQILRVINEYLFRDKKFAGDEQNFYDPENSYFNCVLDRRIGNPISLSLLYLLVARRLRLPVVGVGLPGHFLCRYQSSRAELYVDAFHGGRLLAKADCVKHVIQLRQRFDESCLAPVSPRRILLRICATLHQIYTQQKSPVQIERLQRYLVALAK
ncbi:MAG TPA: transglutaminase-like domain-containing protein [Candidatus Baltobacteraceae bacterium]|jgi:regulator of sirC expression with transglutaminase-like and TPR domain|nr:transglutaminase-like domain-containing protein [Candidatus Baltobacteraceae bacterium]